MDTPFTLRPLGHADLDALSDLIVAVVASGGSISFMHPLPLTEAEAFWRGSLSAAERGERVIFGAFDSARLISTVTLALAQEPNQPHRADIAKMMTHPDDRGRGAATAVLRAAEDEARAHGRWLLVLDTAEDEGAAGMYEKLGYTLTGLIPDFALKPHGGLTGTLVYWKKL
ncbi:GNAT family N-acetyltransferase [Asticcacaulis sp. YBE204]|uniref:GNAT family N-acetyltransferase n=1 Tax=Asticcacaulis sp. YBE204 TaxID=1282363 RepID=UPI0003C3E8A4|nr:GNAT family N-acetyltransferase [Asticcacaulis sp. YBE204]ESQ79138.1 hypothetical protein AEYBE204_10650 [Asticcacaulis sp. YBE204]